MDWIRPIATAVKYAAPFVAPGIGSVVSGGLGALGFGGRRRCATCGQLPRAKRTLNPALAQRNQIVRQIAIERHISIPQASSVVKQEGLWASSARGSHSIQ